MEKIVLSVTEEKLSDGDYLLNIEITEETRNKLEEVLGDDYKEIIQRDFPLYIESLLGYLGE